MWSKMLNSFISSFERALAALATSLFIITFVLKEPFMASITGIAIWLIGLLAIEMLFEGFRKDSVKIKTNSQTMLLLKDAGYPALQEIDMCDAEKWLESSIGLSTSAEKQNNGTWKAIIYDANDNVPILVVDKNFATKAEAYEAAIANACDFYLSL